MLLGPEMSMRLYQRIAPAGGGVNARWDNLIENWKLDETSGARVGTLGTYDLTDNNTVGVSYIGPTGVVSQFTAGGSEYLDNASDQFSALLGNMSSGWSVSFWARWPTGAPDGSSPFGLFTAADSSGARFFDVYPWTGNLNGDFMGAAMPNNVAFPGYDTWHHFVLAYGADTDWVLYVDGTSFWSGTIANATNTAYVVLGRIAGTVYATQNVANVGVWNGRELTSGDVTDLFNGGVAKTYADMSAAEKTTLTAFWNLDEASGNRSDSVGSITLTDNATVTSTTTPGALFGNAARFVTANAESLSVADPTLLRLDSGDKTWCGWVYFNDAALNYNVFGKDQIGKREYLLYRNQSSGVLTAYVFNTVAGAQTVSYGSATTSGAWHFVVMWWDNTAQTVSFSVDDGAVVTSAALTGTPNGTDTIFTLGTHFGGSHLDGAEDEFSVFSEIKDAAWITDMYNSGLGRSYPN